MKLTLRLVPIAALFAMAFTGCTESNATKYETRGRVVMVTPENNTVRILHEEIPGYMESHEMDLMPRDVSALEGLMEGDLVQFNMVVAEDGSVVIDDIEKLPVDTQLNLVEPQPVAPVLPDSALVPDSTMVLEDSTAAM